MATTTTIVKTQIQFRRATTAEWEQYSHVIPSAGEPCFDTELGTLKIGDGVKSYGELKAIGGGDSVAVSADGSSIVLENDVFKLAGFDVAATGAQPRKNAKGELEWFVPAVENTEALQEAIDELQSSVLALQELLTGTGEGSVAAQIAEQINKFATDVSEDGVVNSYKELIEYVATHGGKAAEMAAAIEALEALVGTESVEKQIEAALAGLGANGQENLIEVIKLGDSELAIEGKTVTIPVGAGLTASEEITISEDGKLGLGTIEFSKLIGEDTVLVLDGGIAG